MQRYIIRRLLLMIPTLLGVTFIVFILVRSIPGDISVILAGPFGSDPANRAAIQKEFGLDDNLVSQYIHWLGEIVRLDFGKSILSGRSITDELSNRLPVTLELGLLAILMSLLISIPIGVLSAIRQDSWADYVGRSFAIGLLAAPSFWLAAIAITLAGRYFLWGVPPRTYPFFQDDPIANLKALAMPAFILGAGLAGGVMRFTRSSMLEVLRQDYIRTAWSKGLHERAIIIRHALRNALIPVVTLIGLQLPLIVGGAVIIEQVYSIPGMGRYYISSVNQYDYPAIQAINLIVATAVIVTNLGVDILYSVIDPRIRYS
jgi:peptide/nickel transport system permease protein